MTIVLFLPLCYCGNSHIHTGNRTHYRTEFGFIHRCHLHRSHVATRSGWTSFRRWSRKTSRSEGVAGIPVWPMSSCPAWVGWQSPWARERRCVCGLSRQVGEGCSSGLPPSTQLLSSREGSDHGRAIEQISFEFTFAVYIPFHANVWHFLASVNNNCQECITHVQLPMAGVHAAYYMCPCKLRAFLWYY